MKRIIGILIVGVLVAAAFPCVDASIHITDEKENSLIYESRLFGFGFVYINGFTNTIKGFVLFGIHDGQVISMEFVNIKYNEADHVLAGFLPPLMFYIRYNPA